MPKASEILNRLFDERKIRIKEVMARTGFGRTKIWRQLSGGDEPSLDDREKYAAVLGMTVQQLDALWIENGVVNAGQVKWPPVAPASTTTPLVVPLAADLFRLVKEEADEHGITVDEMAERMILEQALINRGVPKAERDAQLDRLFEEQEKARAMQQIRRRMIDDGKRVVGGERSAAHDSKSKVDETRPGRGMPQRPKKPR